MVDGGWSGGEPARRQTARNLVGRYLVQVCQIGRAGALFLSSWNRAFEQLEVDGRGDRCGLLSLAREWSYGDRSRVAGRQEWMDTWAVGRIGGLTGRHARQGRYMIKSWSHSRLLVLGRRSKKQKRCLPKRKGSKIIVHGGNQPRLVLEPVQIPRPWRGRGAAPAQKVPFLRRTATAQSSPTFDRQLSIINHQSSRSICSTRPSPNPAQSRLSLLIAAHCLESVWAAPEARRTIIRVTQQLKQQHCQVGVLALHR